MNVDPDGVYRAYLANGTVVDAVRLTGANIATFLSAVESVGQLSTAQMAEKRTAFANITGLGVPDAQLLDPPEDVKLKEGLEGVAASVGEAPPLIVGCKFNGYCTDDKTGCAKHGLCVCNGVSCTDSI
jgi:hypothetical protein